MKHAALMSVVVSLFFLSLLSGCGNKSNVTGTWVCTEDSLNIAKGVKLIFKDDGSVAIGPVKEAYTVNGSTVSITKKDGKSLLSLELKDGKLVGTSKTRHIVYERKKK